MKKRKRLFTIIIVIVVILCLRGCGSGGSSDPAAPDGGTSGSTNTTEAVDQSAEEEAEEPSDAATEDAEDADDGSSLISPEFKKTMDDYEAWFDHYCDVMKKYQENQSDLELLSEVSELMAEEAEVFDQMENMDESEMNNAELAYYLEVTARIEKNLLEVAEY